MPYADNNGIKVFYDTYGTGTPIVFLHPWTTNELPRIVGTIHFARAAGAQGRLNFIRPEFLCQR